MKLGLILGVAAACLASAGQAYAQDTSADGQVNPDSSFNRGRNVGVTSRPHPGYEALGQKVGGFIMFPRADIALTYDDNIFATNTGEVSDTFATVTPRVDLVSNWSRNALNFTAQVARSQYFNRTTENHTDYSAGANGRLDVDRSSNINGGVTYSRNTEPRSSIEAFQLVDKPIKYDIGGANIGASKEFNRLRVTGSYNRSHYAYGDARDPNTNALVFEGYRDRTEDVVNAQVDYAVSPDTFIYVKGTSNWRKYDINRAGLIDRDSQGYDVSVGGDFDLTNLLRGHVALGYIRQTFDNKVLFAPVHGLSVSANVDYYPTQLTTVNFHASRNFQASGLVNSAGYSSTAFGATVDHELFRNILLNARLDYERGVQQGIDRQDDRYNAIIGATYLVNRSLGISGSYSYFTQRSSGLQRGSDFNDGRAQVTLTLQY
jgi:hypothetical protein